MAQLFKIVNRHREYVLQFVNARDFEGEPAGEIEASELAADFEWSLYCFDFENDHVVFVRCPSEIEREPFLYTAQFNAAVSYARMDMADFVFFAQGIPAPENLVFVHSVGRCGSTLLSKALQAIAEVQSLSEPDDLTQLTVQRASLGEQRTKDLIYACVRWRCKPTGRRTVAIKTRSEVMVIAPLMCAAFPEAKNLFLYRGAVSWTRSIYRTWPPDRPLDDVDLNRDMQRRWAEMIPLVKELGSETEPFNPLEIRLCSWLQVMEGYLGLRNRGVPFFAFRYEELTQNPREVLRAVFDYVGVSEVDWADIEAVLAEDSQKGSIFDREALDARGMVLSDEQIERVHRLVARRPSILAADVVLPGTFAL
jgi:hypothetical protein